MEEEAICLHIVCITAQCFLPGSHNASCPQQFQRHPSRVHPGQAVSWDKDYLRSKVTSGQRTEATWCQRLLSKSDFQNETKSSLCHRAAVNWDHRTYSRRKVTGVHRLHKARIQRLWWVRSPFRTDYSRYKVLQGHRDKVNLFPMLLKAREQSLGEVKAYFQSKVTAISWP